mgnify:CR=1 FL=1|jgi:hypothetical protein
MVFHVKEFGKLSIPPIGELDIHVTFDMIEKIIDIRV